MLKLVRQWLEAGVMDRRTVSPTVAGTPQGGVIILQRLGLELHPDKKRRVERYDGKQGSTFSAATCTSD